jgi:hypothetical protein
MYHLYEPTIVQRWTQAYPTSRPVTRSSATRIQLLAAQIITPPGMMYIFIQAVCDGRPSAQTRSAHLIVRIRVNTDYGFLGHSARLPLDKYRRFLPTLPALT